MRGRKGVGGVGYAGIFGEESTKQGTRKRDRRTETECAGWRLDDDHLGLVVPLLLLCALGNQFSAKKPYKNGAILKEMRRVDFQMRLPCVRHIAHWRRPRGCGSLVSGRRGIAHAPLLCCFLLCFSVRLAGRACPNRSGCRAKLRRSATGAFGAGVLGCSGDSGWELSSSCRRKERGG